MGVKNNVYTFQKNLMLTSGYQDVYAMESANRNFNVKQIIWDYTLVVTTNQQVLPVYNQSTVQVSLEIFKDGFIPNFQPIASPFTDVPTTINDYNGNKIVMYLPGKLEFENLNIPGMILFRVTFNNNDPMNDVAVGLMIICEINQEN